MKSEHRSVTCPHGKCNIMHDDCPESCDECLDAMERDMLKAKARCDAGLHGDDCLRAYF